MALFFSIVMLAIWVAAVGITATGTLLAFIYFRKGVKPVEENQEWMPVTILKPLKGIDPGLEENLDSFFNLDYPKFEILFSVADQDDPVIPGVKRLIARYPQIATKLYIGAENFGFNPKINNLIKAYDNSQYGWVLISDSNTRFSRDHLKRLVRQIKEGVSLQTSVVAGVEPRGLGGLLEAVFLNTFYARSMVMVDAAGLTCVMGKAMLFQKSIMDKTRGLRSLKKHINEDYAAGRKFQLLGHKVQLSDNPVRQHIGNYSIGAFWSRHLRWGRIRKMQAPLVFLVEPVFSSILSGLLGTLAFYRLWGVSPALFLPIHMGFWLACDMVMASKVGDPLGWSFLPAWSFREAIHIPLWIHISLGSTVIWRGQELHLKRASILETRAESASDSQARKMI